MAFVLRFSAADGPVKGVRQIAFSVLGLEVFWELLCVFLHGARSPALSRWVTQCHSGEDTAAS